MHWSVEAVVRAVHGRILDEGSRGSGIRPSGLELTGVSIDSRTLRDGDLFVAIKGERDGHDFIDSALSRGASALLVDRSELAPRGTSVPVVVVGDTGRALLSLGAAARDRMAATVVGITGSVGKTSTKDLAAAAAGVGRRTVSSERSFNNELGVPLTLANADDSAEVVVLEMGSRGPGHILLLCGVARPTVAVVTSVAAAHTEMFGGLDAIADAKGELVQSLPGSGTAVLNADDPRVWKMRARSAASVIGYTTATPPADGALVRAERVELDPELRPSFELRSPWGQAKVRLEARGAHQVGNALAALTVAVTCGVDLEAAVGAMERARLSPWRMEVGRSSSGALILNDAYNANPASMAAALRALAQVRAAERIAVLGFMAELGERSRAEHREVAAMADRMGIRVVALGTELYGGEVVADADGALDLLAPLRPSQALLVKASRVAGLEDLAARLLRA